MTGACPCCGAPTALADAMADDRYGEPGRFPLLACPACGHRHLGGGAATLDPGRLYGERYPRREIDPAAWRPTARRGGMAGWLTGERGAACFFVPPRVRVLDIGAGLGEALGWHRCRGCVASGTDADPALERIASAHGLDVRIGPFRAADWPTATFDVITLDQVIEHLPDPVAGLRDVAGLLRPGGRVVIATPNGASILRRILGRRWVQWHAPYHLHIFSPRSLAHAVRRAGLRPVARGWITPSDWLLYQIRHLAEPAPRPGAPAPWWSPGSPRPLPGRLIGALAGRFHRMVPLLHLLARAFDAAHRGDNQLLLAERPR